MPGLGPLFAIWPFSSAGMLWWGLAAAIPVVIHLWNRRRHDEVSWGAMQFLLAAVQKQARRMRVEHWLLLSVRTLILLVFACALADPVLSLFAPAAIRSERGIAHVVFVIDGSYSMSYRSADKSRFELAQQAAWELVEASSQGDGFTLVVMSERPEVVLHEPAFDPRDLRQELLNLTPTHRGASLGPTLTAVEELLAKAARQHPRLTEARVYFLTDLGHSTWRDVESESVQQQLVRLSEIATLRVADVGQVGVSNLAVTSLERMDPMVTAGRPVAFIATVQNFGDQTEESRSLELYVDEQRVASRPVRAASGDTASVQFDYPFAAPGEHRVEVRLDNDPLTIDNHRWLSVPVRDSVRVLCVEGQLAGARSVAFALNPWENEPGAVVVETASESSLLDRELSDYDCVFLCDVSRFDQNEADALRRYLVAGGGLVVFPGAQVQAENYNTLLGSKVPVRTESAGSAPEERVLPAQLGDVVRDGSHTFDPGDFSHPLARTFRSVPGSGLFRIPLTYRYLRLTPYGPSSQVVFRYETGDPALVDESIGSGRCFLFASSGSTDSVDRTSTPAMPWSVLATARDFVSLIQELIPLLVQGREAGRNLTVGDVIAGSMPKDTPGAPLMMTLPDGRTERVPIENQGSQRTWTYDAGTWSGVYTARWGQPLETRYFAVNIDPQESDLRRLDRERLPSQLRVNPAGDQTPTRLGGAPHPRAYFRYLLAAVLALLLIETWLAWRFRCARATP